MTNGK